MNTDRARKSWDWGRLLAIVLATMLVAAACGSNDDDSEADSSFGDTESSEDSDAGGDDSDGGFDAEAPAAEFDDAEFDDDAMSEEEAAVEEGEPSSADSDTSDGDASPLGAGGTTVTPTAADIGRKLIFTAFLNVEVDDVAAASAEATAIIEGMGGFLFGQSTEGGAQARSELTFKVLPDDFATALERLGSVGELRNQSITTDDVTERIVDLESRIEVAQLGVTRLRATLEETQSLEDFAEIERLLLARESDLEVMRGQLRTLQDRVDLATITLLLTQDRIENSIEVDVSAYQDHDAGASCPGQRGSSVESGSDVTICFDIVNVGDQTLTKITLTDTVLGIDAETELIEVFGSLDELAPGQAALVAYEVNPERTLRLRTRVVAIPTDGTSPEQVGPSVSTQVGFELRTFESEGDPGFGDGFSAAVDILRGIWIAIKLVIGFLIPLLILLPFVWLGWMAVRAIRRRRPPTPSAGPPGGPAGGSMPPPPVPDPVPEPAAAPPASEE